MTLAVRWTVAFAVALGCGSGGPEGESDRLSFDIDLVDACPVAEPFYFGIRSVEVQLRADDDGAPCVAARRCVQVAFDSVWDPEAIEADLRAVAQPLLSTDRSADDFKIIGSDAVDCSFSNQDAVFLCGTADLSAVGGGVLEVPVDCAESSLDFPVCPVEPLPDCR